MRFLVYYIGIIAVKSGGCRSKKIRRMTNGKLWKGEKKIMEINRCPHCMRELTGHRGGACPF